MFALLLAPVLLTAQAWKTATTLNGVDMNGLNPAQTAAALKVMREYGCVCGCSMKVAECRVQDPACTYSRGIAAAIVTAARAGKSEADIRAAAAASPAGRPPQPGKLLDDPVKIPVSGAPWMGPATAKITLVEFSDFQCPYCRIAAPELHELLKEYPTQVKLIFKEFPLDEHSQAALAAKAAQAAHNQGKFWEMHDALFADHADIDRAKVISLAKKFSLDPKKFVADLDSRDTNNRVVQDIADGTTAGVEGTPTLFIDGQRFNGPINVGSLKPVLDAKLKH